MSATVGYPKPFIEWGVAARALPGQSVSGDLHLVKRFAHGALVAVVDGLGHGDDATAAAKTAVAVLEKNARLPVVTLVQQCHEALRRTRGAVMTLASLNVNARHAMLSWLCVGNVVGLLLRAAPNAAPASEGALARGGVVGYQLPALQETVTVIAPNDLLILASDGISSGFERDLMSLERPQQIADGILSRHFKGTDDGLVLVVRYLGTRHE